MEEPKLGPSESQLHGFSAALGQKAVCKPKGHKGSNPRLLWPFLSSPELWLKHKGTHEFSFALMASQRHPKTPDEESEERPEIRKDQVL